MRKRALLLAFVLSASFAFGQIDSNTITVTAYRTTVAQPDQIVFYVDVSSDQNTSLDDVIAALAGSGITIDNFLGLSAYTSRVEPGTMMMPVLDWSFVLPVAWSKMKDTTVLLAGLQKTIGQKNNTLALSFGIRGTQVSQQLRQSQVCSVPDLLSDARARAEKLASAANAFVGAVLAISSTTSTDNNAAADVYPYYAYTPSTCSATVKFALSR